MAVASPFAFRERGGQAIPTPPFVGYPSLVHATRPLRSSPLAGPSLSSNSIISRQSQSTAAPGLDVRPYSLSARSHAGSPSASTSSFSSNAHRAPRTPAGSSKSAGSTSTLNLDSRPHSPPSSVASHTSTSPSSHAHSAPRVVQVKSTSAVPTLSLFRRQGKEDPSPPPPTQPPFAHNRSISFAHNTVSPPAHIPKTYNPRAPRPTTAPAPSRSRDPDDNWMASSPFGPAATPRFSRQSMSAKPVIMPLSAREYRRQKRTSVTSNAAYPVTSYSPAEEGRHERVNDLPHIVISDAHSSHIVAPSGNRPSRRASSPSPPRSAVSQPILRGSSPEPQLSSKSSHNTFVSFTSENEAESSVIKVVDPGVAPRRRLSTPNPTRRHSRLSLVDAVNRLSVASGDTEFFDTEEHTIARRISVTEDDGVLRRVSSRRKPTDAPYREVALANTVAKEPLAPQEYPRMVRIAETCEISSDKSLSPGVSSKFSDSSHECQHEDGPERSASGGISTHQDALQPMDSKPPVSPFPESRTRSPKKLTKPRIHPVEVPFIRSGSSSSWIPETSALKNSSSDVSQLENVLESHETGDSGKGRKRWTSRLTFKFFPSRLKSTPSVSPSLDQKRSMRNETPPRSSRAESGFGMGYAVAEGSATSTITLVPPPPIMCSSSVSSSAANSTSSLTDSSTTMLSRDTSATSIGSPSLMGVSRLEQPYPITSSNLKESIVIKLGGDIDSDQSEVQQEKSRDETTTTTTPPIIASRDDDHELREASSLSSVSSYVSFPSISTAAGSISNVPDGKVSGYLHPMWTVPMLTAAAAPQTALPASPTVREPPVRPTVIPPAPASKIPSTRPHTARLKRPRPQTAPSSPKPAVFSPGMPSSGFKSILRNLVGRAG